MMRMQCPIEASLLTYSAIIKPSDEVTSTVQLQCPIDGISSPTFSEDQSSDEVTSKAARHAQSKANKITHSAKLQPNEKPTNEVGSNAKLMAFQSTPFQK